MAITIGPLARNLGLLLAIGGLIYAVACFFLFALQRSMLYQPQGTAAKIPHDDLKLAVDGADLQVTVRRLPGSKALIYFGGNGENVTLTLPSFSSAFPDRSLFLLHYRGYEGSTGKPSERALQSDALVLFDRVQRDYSDIAVMGRSLGSGVAIRVASERPVQSLVLVTPYNSIQEIAARKFPWAPIRWLLLDKFESWRHAPKVRAPTLLLIALDDDLIPPTSTEQLVTAFSPGIASVKRYAHFGHGDISSSAAYFPDINAAFDRADAATSPTRQIDVLP
jgi:pimeloyl-ACP methyl ester carboxylesterase